MKRVCAFSLFSTVCIPRGTITNIPRVFHMVVPAVEFEKIPLEKRFLAPAVTVGETEGAMDSTSVFFLPLLLPITL